MSIRGLWMSSRFGWVIKWAPVGIPNGTDRWPPPIYIHTRKCSCERFSHQLKCKDLKYLCEGPYPSLTNLVRMSLTWAFPIHTHIEESIISDSFYSVQTRPKSIQDHLTCIYLLRSVFWVVIHPKEIQQKKNQLKRNYRVTKRYLNCILCKKCDWVISLFIP